MHVNIDSTYPSEYIDIYDIDLKKNSFLYGVISTLRNTSSSESSICYIWNPLKQRIIWLSKGCMALLSQNQTAALENQTAALDDLLCLYPKEDLLRIKRYEESAFRFILSNYGNRFFDFNCRSNIQVFFNGFWRCCERIVSILSIQEGQVHTVLCRLLPSSHKLSGIPRIINCYTGIYYRLHPNLRYWIQKVPIALNNREQQILILSSQGLTEHEISDRLYISSSRIKTIKANIMRKLKVKNIHHAIYRAYIYGLIMAVNDKKYL